MDRRGRIVLAAIAAAEIGWWIALAEFRVDRFQPGARLFDPSVGAAISGAIVLAVVIFAVRGARFVGPRRLAFVAVPALLALATALASHLTNRVGGEELEASSIALNIIAAGVAAAGASIRRSVVAIVVIAGGGLAAATVWTFSAASDPPAGTRADAAVILGAAVWSHDRPSPALRARIERARELIASGVARRAICTGGNALGESAEADVEARELLRAGVPPDSILVERRTSSTFEQARYLRDSLEPKGIRTFVIVSDHWHLRRALAMCGSLGVEAHGASSATIGAEELWPHVREAAALIHFWLCGG
jgi:uncharacterized SAM-binding protein YcdF (DUF218 family)